MIQAGLLIGLTYLAVVLQTSLCPLIRIHDAAPNLLALEALAVAMVSSSPYAFLWAGWIGLLHDMASADRMGVAMFWFALVGYLVGRVRGQVYTEGFLVRTGVVLAGSSLIAGGLVASTRILGPTGFAWEGLLAQSLGVGGYTAAVAIPIFGAYSFRGRPALAD